MRRQRTSKRLGRLVDEKPTRDDIWPDWNTAVQSTFGVNISRLAMVDTLTPDAKRSNNPPVLIG